MKRTITRYSLIHSDFFNRVVKSYLTIILCALSLSLSAKPYPNSFHQIPAEQPKAGTMFMFPERIKLESGGFTIAERGLIFVPLNRSKPHSDVIGVEVYRFKAIKKASKNTPPVFYLPGGPGYDGLEPILNSRPNHYENRIKPHLHSADLIIVSQRGIGPSKPTTTIETTLSPLPLDEPYNRSLRDEKARQKLAAEKEQWQSLGVDLTGYNVLEAAEDINDIRVALGYDKITLWGGSFGSHWAMAMMRLHPNVVERALLWGMEGPDHTYDHPGHIWNVFRRVANEAESSNELKPIIPTGGLIAAAESIVHRVEKSPFTVEVKGKSTGKVQTVLFNGDSIRQLIQGYSDDGIQAWPADILTMYYGDYKPAAEYLAGNFNSHRRRFSTASFYMLDCGSGITKKRQRDYDADPAANLIPYRNWAYVNGCPLWGSNLGDVFRQNFHSNIPTLILHGTWDQFTPYENAQELAPYFKKSKFISVERGPHWAIGKAMAHSAEIRHGVRRFIETGDMSQLPTKIVLDPIDWKLPANSIKKLALNKAN